MVKCNQIILGIAVLFTCNLVFGQSKQEIKEWKSKLKATDPMEFKKMVEKSKEVGALEKENYKLQNEVTNLRTENEDRDQRIVKLESELKDKPQESSGSAPVKKSSGSSYQEPDYGNGVIFKVQIGAFRKKNLTKYLKKHKNFSGEVDEDGLMKYTLGVFDDYWEANKFKKYLREMGVKDAWIVSYKGKERIDIKDALEGVVQ